MVYDNNVVDMLKGLVFDEAKYKDVMKKVRDMSNA